ncbi:hypothetical protein [Microcoleus sp. SVA1_B3]|uniref:hypothetical protein n=1 Tax=Microcoleus sp. SVA1_B3 TaxID=2818950 RepID=UPI002FD6D2DF
MMSASVRRVVPQLSQRKKSRRCIRAGDYRIGLTFDADIITFVRVLHRQEVYRYFREFVASQLSSPD